MICDKMPFPNSPFSDDFNQDLLIRSGSNAIVTNVENQKLDELLQWLCKPPKVTIFKVNTLLTTVTEAKQCIDEYLEKLRLKYSLPQLKVYIDDCCKEMLVIEHFNANDLNLEKSSGEVMVDVHCAAAVLRGAHIYAPGVLGMTTDCKLGDTISVYVDISKKCKKGYKQIYEDANKVFIGNGIVKMNRNDLFVTSVSSGIAIEMLNSISGCPPLGNEFVPSSYGLLQNAPSVICVEILNPQPGDSILDMCAAPGNKTTHIAAKMNNNGTLVAIDKTASKIKNLQAKCELFNANVCIFQADSTAIFDKQLLGCDVSEGPPFAADSFDKILLDAPCSALGQRPQFANNESEKVINSFVPVQRKLFHNAVHLLKPNGYLAYSTCTITFSENEALVVWALSTFPNLELVATEPYRGANGWKCDGFNEKYVQRFGPNNDNSVDSVGFFIAMFRKTKQLDDQHCNFCLNKL